MYPCGLYMCVYLHIYIYYYNFKLRIIGLLVCSQYIYIQILCVMVFFKEKIIFSFFIN